MSKKACFTVGPKAEGGQIDVRNGETLLTTDMEKKRKGLKKEKIEKKVGIKKV